MKMSSSPKLSLPLLLLFLSLPSWATKVVGNGGDTYALEFITVAKDIYTYLKISQPQSIPLDKLDRILNEAQVESTDEELYLNKLPKEAINYPAKKRIIFNRTAWLNMKEGLKPTLVLHEYLGLLGLDDSSYAISTAALKNFGYGKKVTEIEGPFTINFATARQYSLKAHVTLENYGPQNWHYDADNEQIRLIFEAQGKRKIFLLPTKGRVISAFSNHDNVDDGITVNILQPAKNAAGEPQVHPEKGSLYFLHLIREYRIELHGKTRGALPDDIDFVGPISNLAG